MKSAKVSVIIPVYNEQEVIDDCLKSLTLQTYKQLEIVIVDDGSDDRTVSIVENLKLKIMHSQGLKSENLLLLEQNHLGPGIARNLGASRAKGDILVFVDSDMVFDKDFIKDLVKPILNNDTIGTFSKNEFNANKDNVWSRCWNLNRTKTVDKLISENSPDTSPVFRAILKKEFQKVGGFTSKGEYTDDWSLFEKLGKKASLAPGAVYYHSNPSSPGEIWKQAQWFSTNKFISGNFVRFTKSLIFYSFPASLFVGAYKAVVFRNLRFLFFRILFDFAVWIALFKSFSSKNKTK